MKKHEMKCEKCYALNPKGWCKFGIPIYYQRDKDGDKGHMPMAPCTPISTFGELDLVCLQNEITPVRQTPYVVEFYKQRKRKKDDVSAYRWRVVAPNTKIIIPPESHPKLQHVKRAAINVADVFKNKYVCYRELV